jgi:[acyl-carrier-protein] S-malonyltransferase
MSNYSIIFPGQGSQSVGMMDTFANNAAVKDTFAEASQILKKDFWEMATRENTDIHLTENTQPMMLIAGICIWRILKKSGVDKPKFLAGHSLGEFSALVAAEVISFEDALGIVSKRAQLMQAAVPEGIGAMAAILGLDDKIVIDLCKNIESAEVIEPVNFNSPGQVVIAGHRAIIEKSLDDFKRAGAKRALLLPVSVPSHCELMKPAAKEFESYLSTFHFQQPQLPVVHNVDCKIHSDVNQIKSALVNQLYNPVQWTRSIEYIALQNVNIFIEAGPGKVLTSLNKRIHKESESYSTQSLEVLQQTIELIKG